MFQAVADLGSELFEAGDGFTHCRLLGSAINEGSFFGAESVQAGADVRQAGFPFALVEQSVLIGIDQAADRALGLLNLLRQPDLLGIGRGSFQPSLLFFCKSRGF